MTTALLITREIQNEGPPCPCSANHCVQPDPWQMPVPKPTCSPWKWTRPRNQPRNAQTTNKETDATSASTKAATTRSPRDAGRERSSIAIRVAYRRASLRPRLVPP